MPALSMFYGIIVRMQSEKGGRHHKPHIHAIYGDDEIVIALDGEVLEGWMAIHEDEMMANWKMLSAGEGYFKIEPLR